MGIELHDIQQQLSRLAASRELVRSHKLLRFIDFTVEEMLAGRGHTLAEHRIGTEVYERPAHFDPQLDGIVRTEARRLRKKLDRYYAGAGQNDPVVLEYPIGSYVPTFRGAGPSHYLEVLSNSHEMAERIRDFDWALTKLGAISTWPTTLKLAVETCLRSKVPSLVCWGADFLVIYNDAKAREIGKRHPWALSRAAASIFPNSWERLKPIAQRVLQDGEQAWAVDERFLVETAGYPEERYFTLLFTPISDGNSGTGGIAVAADETTTRVIGERRARILAELALRMSPAGDISAVYRTAAAVLNEDPFDVPFACLYGVRNGRMVAVLEATAGVSPGTALSPESVVFDTADAADSGFLAHAFRNGSRELIDLGEGLTDLPSGAWKRTPTSIVVVPIVEQRGPTNPSGFLVAGMSPHSHLDKDYRAFWESVATEIAKAVNEARAEDEKRKLVEQLSASDRAKADFF